MDETTQQTPTPSDVFEILAIMAEQLGELAWAKLGLRPDPFTGTLDKNLSQARAAIDVVVAIGEKVKPQLDASDRMRYESLEKDLRINFLNQSS